MKDDAFRRLVLTAEIAALLHDIGKYSESFFLATMRSNNASQGGNASSAHTQKFFEQLTGSNLLEKLKADWPFEWPKKDEGTNKKIAPLRAIGDLARWHHAVGNIESYFLKQDRSEKLFDLYPAALGLMMIADTIDSATVKGNLDNEKLKQDLSEAFLITPFGMKECEIDPPNESAFKENLLEFHDQLADILEKVANSNTSIDQLIDRRKELLEVLKKHLSCQLAETRVPRNDVSLWQHCYYAAAIFKAALAGRVLRGDWKVFDEKEHFAHYNDPLAILGISWSEDELISKAYRPKDVLGRRTLLDKATQAIKERLETEFCLGNEIFRNRDGIYFLVPAKKHDENHKDIQDTLNEFVSGLDGIINGEDYIQGELSWRARYLDIGIQPLKLAELLSGEAGEELSSGPKRPQWLNLWKDKTAKSKEICPRCGLRPVELVAAPGGSEADRDRMCLFCKEIIQEEAIPIRMQKDGLYSDESREQAVRLLGIGPGVEYCCYYIDDLLKDDGISPDENRLILIQGIIDQRPFLSGRAFSCLIAAPPEFHDNKFNSWDKMLGKIEAAWKSVDGSGPTNVSSSKDKAKNFRSLFCDNYIGKLEDKEDKDGTKKVEDGRVPGDTKDEKLINFLEQIVLASPFDKTISNDIPAKIVNYAVRMHPAPSRLARMWEITDLFTREPVLWCEENRIPYTPITRDTGHFMVLVSAARAWELMQHLVNEYESRFSKVRHLLPLHLSATVFYHKAPLYIAIDAARRFSELAQQHKPEQWTLEKKEYDANAGRYSLSWLTPGGRSVHWYVAGRLPDGREDRFFTWYWTKRESRRPVHISELEPGDEVTVHPSTFDYEVLDATVRRYDIRKDHRPHAFMKTSPRPYPLVEIKKWAGLSRELKATPANQIKQLLGQMEYAHRFWSGARYEEARRGFLSDCVSLALPAKRQEEFQELAADGSLFDLFEWCDLIRRNEIDGNKQGNPKTTGEGHE